jgi:cytochrome c peroxidase
MANPSVSYVLNKLRRLPEYQASFEQAFPKQGIRMETVGMALASYQRVLQAGNSAFDRWYYLGQQDAISVEAQQGFALFQGKGGCASCHSIDKEWALFTDQQLHNTGIGYQNLQQSKLHKVQLAPGVEVEVSRELINQVSEPPPSDLGLYEITQNPADRWKYRTPSLRNVTLTAPYMHNGALQDLAAVIDFYDQGGIANPELSPLMRPLYLTAAEKQQLLSFLNTLTGSDVDKLVDDAMKAPIGDHQVVYSANLSPNKH